MLKDLNYLLINDFSKYPYKVLICAILLIRTRYTKVFELLPLFFKKYPNVLSIKNVELIDLEKILYPLGLHKKRAIMIKELALYVLKQGFPKTRNEVEKLPFAGRYVSDLYSLIILRDYDLESDDEELRILKELLKQEDSKKC